MTHTLVIIPYPNTKGYEGYEGKCACKWTFGGLVSKEAIKKEFQLHLMSPLKQPFVKE